VRISMFTNTYLPHIGGVARSVSTFVEDLIAAGHDVQVVAPTFPGQQEDDADYILRVPAIQNFNGSDFSVRIPLTGEIREEISDFEPDIIHSHHPFLLGDSAVRMSRLLGTPLIFTHHTRYEQYTHYVPLDSPALKRFVSDLATEYANICNQVIAPSHGIKELIHKRGVRSSITVLPTGIDIKRFRSGNSERFRQLHSIDPQMVVIGHVGRLAAEKNLLFLTRAVAAAVQAKPTMKFVVAGKGNLDDGMREIFQQQGIDDSLILTGSLSGSDLADCYAAMDVFVFASQSETQGLVLAEAMAAGVPVAALSATGVDDVLTDQVNGIRLAADASEDALASAILSLADDTDLRQKLRTGAVKTAEKFSRQSSCNQLIALYRTVIDEERSSHRVEKDLLDAVMISIKAEWELLQEKTAAALKTIAET
jgi:1,2-diacylglycerol 3-alpha-glucosyltransferase